MVAGKPLCRDDLPSRAEDGLTDSEPWGQAATQRLLDVALGVAAAGHDLKNLLAVASGNIQMATAELGVVPGELSSGKQSLDQAITLLRDLMQVTNQVQSAGVSDVAAVVQETVMFSRSVWANVPHLVLTTDLQALPRAAVSPLVLRRVLVNLILNAVRAMPDGGSLRIRTAVEGDLISVVLQDSGAGMDVATLRAIRQPFATQHSEGIGLGLASCRFLIEQAKGRLEVASTLGVGTSVTISIPALIPED